MLWPGLIIKGIADLCCQDFVSGNISELEDLSRIGSSGHCPQNCRRDLLALHFCTTSLPKPMQEGINFASPLGLQQQTILYPHEVFACIYEKYPATWQRSVVPSTHRLHQFWEETAEHPQMLGHPVSLRSDHREKCVPLAIHGDGVPITGIGKSWCKLATSFLWFSLLTTGSTTDMLFLIWAYFDQLISTGEISTLDEFFARLKWSFLQLWHGTWSDKDWQGQPCFWPSVSISFYFFCRPSTLKILYL